MLKTKHFIFALIHPSGMAHAKSIIRTIANAGFVVEHRTKYRLMKRDVDFMSKCCKEKPTEDAVSQLLTNEVFLLNLSKETEPVDFDGLRGKLKTLYGSGKEEVLSAPLVLFN